MRILIFGGREFDDLRVFLNAMEEIAQTLALYDDYRKNTVIEGGATGAGFIGRCFAKYAGWGWEQYKAEWKRYGNSAGPIRNTEMIEKGRPDLAIGFPGGTGTADMLAKALKYVPTVVTVDAAGKLTWHKKS